MSAGGGTATKRGRVLPSPAGQQRWHAFPGRPMYVGAARAYVVSDVADWPADDRHWVGVCTSEIATNAVRHSQSGCVDHELNGHGGHFGVRVIRDDPLVRVEVADYGKAVTVPTLPPITDDGIEGRPGDEIRVGGLGLNIVEELCEEWGFRSTKISRVTWFVFRRQAALEHGCWAATTRR